ncbi:pseudouridine synthase [Vallitalea okinawensis]|uniref:pseudouridine synthase n=1 Tax=Vallitalea okinawensis TaxID=2078660 RepID=UPI000CFA8EEC|nr:pseudouridine synthase [Vallitalea okinawensis]
MEVRLQKYLAEAGIASRRKAEQFILEGKVSVNGKVVKEMGVKINPKKDVIKFNGKPVKKEQKMVYILLNKPTGYISTAKEQFDRPTVMDLLKGVEGRVYPVGRLDSNTSGLLLLTNDGDFTYRVTHPKHELKKTYRAVVKGIPNEKKIEILRKGIEIEDYKTAPAKVRITDKRKGSSVIEITIHEGRNRQVRKMLEAIGHPVLRLRRVAIGDIHINKLKEGTYRHLTTAERKSLLQ